MVLTAGVISQQAVGSNTDQLVSTAASGGTGPYTVQWYRSTTSGYSPGPSYLISGATSLTLSDSGLVPNTTYYYYVIYTDTGHSNDTVTSNKLTVTTIAPSQNINQFAQSPFLGMLDLKVGTTNVVAVQIDSTQSGVVYAGGAVNVQNNTNGVPTVVASSADTDSVSGFLVYDIKSQGFAAGQMAEMAMAGSVMWLYATTAIDRFAQVVLDLTSPGSVQAATGSDTIIGFAYDQATAYGQLIRVKLSSPSFLVN